MSEGGAGGAAPGRRNGRGPPIVEGGTAAVWAAYGSGTFPATSKGYGSATGVPAPRRGSILLPDGTVTVSAPGEKLEPDSTESTKGLLGAFT